MNAGLNAEKSFPSRGALSGMVANFLPMLPAEKLNCPPKAQVSIEAIVSISVLMFVLLVVYVQLNDHQSQLNSLSSTSMHRNDCEKVGAAISLVQNQNANGTVEFRLYSDAYLSSGQLEFSDYYCYIPQADNINAVLTAGNVRVKRSNGVVSFENF